MVLIIGNSLNSWKIDYLVEMKKNDPFLLKVCEVIEQRTGRRIETISDARWLAGRMNSQKLLISAHTLARIWGIIKPFHNPYKATLDTLAVFTGYRHWDDFCDHQPLLFNDPNFFLTENPEGFSLSLLEIALANEDVVLAGWLIKKFTEFDNERLCFDTAMVLGHYLRQMNEKDQMLRMLAGSETGRRLFYERFVDEDDPDGYFSKGLLDYYLPRVKKKGRQAFAYSFLISHEAYRQNLTSKHFPHFFSVIKNIDYTSLHFHELSRILESNIIWNGFNGTLEDTWESHLTRALNYCNNLTLRGETWVIYRFLKPMAFFGLTKDIAGHSGLLKKVNDLFSRSNWRTCEISDYFIQLYFLLNNRENKEMSFVTPFRLSFFTYFNERLEKTAIDAAIAWLYAADENKIILEKNLRKYCREMRVAWIENLIALSPDPNTPTSARSRPR